MSNAFLSAAVAEVPRLLAALCRSPSSPHYGCFDRNYWHYRSHVMPCARMQEGMYTLALLYLEPFEGNPHHGDPRFGEWLEAAIRFTCAIQHRDGSFDEWYPREGSFVATSFVTNALAETLLAARRKEASLACEEEALRCLRSAGRWLTDATETTVANQSAGAIAALSGASEALGDERLAAAARSHLEALLARQSDEGWWAEYGGPDIGYLSLHLDYLSRHMARDRREEAVEAVRRALGFLEHFLHPDFSAGGEYMARNTEYLIPSGFVRLAGQGIEEARLPAAVAHRGVALGRGVTPRSLDDRYTTYVLYNWLEAGLGWQGDDSAADSLADRRFDRWFPESGLRVTCEESTYFVTNLHKGGAFRLYAGDRVAVDSGAELVGRGRIAGSLSGARGADSGERSCESRFSYVPVREPVLSPVKGGAFYAVQSAVGWLPGSKKALKSMLRRKSILYGGSGIEGSRRFEWSDDRLVVIDTVEGGLTREDLRLQAEGAYILVPSSKYFSPGDRWTVETETVEQGNRLVVRRAYEW